MYTMAVPPLTVITGAFGGLLHPEVSPNHETGVSHFEFDAPESQQILRPAKAACTLQ
jgi:hypothetical protein